MEAALKLKEVAYTSTHGYATGEMKHGPLATIGDARPCVFICPEKSLFEKNVSSINEVCARKGMIIIVKQKGQEFPKECLYRTIELPNAPDFILPVLSVVPMQLLSMYIGLEKKLNVDKPRHLAKSVTVE